MKYFLYAYFCLGVTVTALVIHFNIGIFNALLFSSITIILADYLHDIVIKKIEDRYTRFDRRK